MAKRKVISCRLSESSVQNAIKQLRDYQQRLKDKIYEFTQALAEAGIPVVESNISDACYTYDEKGIRSGSNTSHNTYVKVNSYGTQAVSSLVVDGREILFIEFGAGVWHKENGPAGSSPHPKGSEFGYVIGSYGQGHGVEKQWGYYNEAGDFILTHGVKATMPMYRAAMKMATDYVAIARRVFGNG